jgi:hypothetical protein
MLAGAGLLLCACVSVPNIDETFATQPIDRTSPAAVAVADIVNAPGAYPTFASIPEPPADVRTAAQWKADVEGQKQTAAALAAAVGPSTWTLSESEAFATMARAEAQVGVIKPPTDAEMAESAAYAKALRAKASPPPRPH